MRTCSAAGAVEDEFRATLDLTKFVLESVGLKDYRVQLSLRDPDSDKYWAARRAGSGPKRRSAKY